MQFFNKKRRDSLGKNPSKEREAEFTTHILQSSADGNLVDLIQWYQLALNSGIVPALSQYSLINCCDIHGKTPLHLAAIHGHLKAVEFLLENGSDCNYQVFLFSSNYPRSLSPRQE